MIVKGSDKHKTIICPSQHSVKYKVVNLQRISQKQQKKVQNLKAPQIENIPGNVRKSIHKDRFKLSRELRSFPFTVLDDIIC